MNIETMEMDTLDRSDLFAAAPAPAAIFHESIGKCFFFRICASFLCSLSLEKDADLFTVDEFQLYRTQADASSCLGGCGGVGLELLTEID